MTSTAVESPKMRKEIVREAAPGRCRSSPFWPASSSAMPPLHAPGRRRRLVRVRVRRLTWQETGTRSVPGVRCCSRSDVPGLSAGRLRERRMAWRRGALHGLAVFVGSLVVIAPSPSSPGAWPSPRTSSTSPTRSGLSVCRPAGRSGAILARWPVVHATWHAGRIRPRWDRRRALVHEDLPPGRRVDMRTSNGSSNGRSGTVSGITTSSAGGALPAGPGEEHPGPFQMSKEELKNALQQS